MGSKFSNLEIIKFLFVSFLYSAGFLVLYLSKVSLGYIVTFQPRLAELFILKIQNSSVLEFIITYFGPFFILAVSLFFAAGLYLVSIYIIPLGETYEKELKKWKHFRVGSRAVSKALFILFLLVFVGSLTTYSLDNSYQRSFTNATISSLKTIMSSELNNIQSEEFTEDLVQKRMEEVKKQYPNLTEEQYSEIEERLRIFVNGTVSTEDTNMSDERSI